MGTWGSGHLDSDGALDTVSERSAELVGRVWDALRDPSSREADEYGYDALFVDLTWLLHMAGTPAFSGWDLPPKSEVEPVLAAWIEGWGTYFDGLAGPEFKAERQAVIEASFAELVALCATWEARRA
ncbi:MAG: hypothetical protein KC656_13230 [Myxococcales bacterium]|nr:hypothetical protein [Myxococcales bacterium]MCB9673144.1 DUF4259 domain-containing protein [Alphaproteobacteria bacterium]MCB9691897.1 DUF4259 domain-containing protein [Alphaproteobacteria bacterium]